MLSIIVAVMAAVAIVSATAEMTVSLERPSAL
ncbi:hypothetical protein PC116_g33675 [Phytophthora cactorum]|nr:hypothetical protein PC116_g33675 [Phytophthora cactorum]